MNSPIVTLTTDWGTSDFFVGKFKGKLFSQLPDVRIVDITHEIPAFNKKSAYFVVKSACMDYPEGTIHIIDVNSSDTADTPTVVVKYKGQFFICVDDGLPCALFGKEVEDAVVVDKVYWDSDFSTFSALDYFCKVAVMLAKGTPLSEIGYPVEEFSKWLPIERVDQADGVLLYVSYIDIYGNADLSMKYSDFVQLLAGRGFKMQVHDFELRKICSGYGSLGNGNSLMLTVSSSGYLQLAVNEGSAAQMFGLRVDELVRVTFFSSDK